MPPSPPSLFHLSRLVAPHPTLADPLALGSPEIVKPTFNNETRAGNQLAHTLLGCRSTLFKSRNINGFETCFSVPIS